MSLRILLDDQIEKLFEKNPEYRTVNKDDFEIATASFANLNHLHGLEFDDLIDGICGGGGDEGIDMCYVFNNGELVTNDNPLINSESNVKVKFFQAKKIDSFPVSGFRNLKEGIEQIFNLDLDVSKLKKIGANQEIIDKAELIRNVFRIARREGAIFSCETYYVTASNSVDIPEKIIHLQAELKENNLEIPHTFYNWGAQNLINIGKVKSEELSIVFHSQPLSIKEKSVPTFGYAGFVSGDSLMKSLIDENMNFRSSLTEGNVRYFLGEDKKINSSIIESTVDTVKSSNFWAMNNGLTVIGDDITPLGNTEFQIKNPQIVNGCQTIHCLYESYEKYKRLDDNLKVFVKLVNTNDLEVQTDIISATNSQNSVKSASLKSNDDIQKNIEEHLKKYSIYYERRENYYKRQGYGGNSVIGLLKMGQIVHSSINKESIVAVNDTTTLFETKEKYESIFSEKADFDMYAFSCMLYQKIWTLKNSDLRSNQYEDDERSMISKSGFVILHIMSTLLMSRARYLVESKYQKSALVNKIDIESPKRKNEFSKRSKELFKDLENQDLLDSTYTEAKGLFFLAAQAFESQTDRGMISLFKYRNFDKDYVIPILKKHLTD